MCLKSLLRWPLLFECVPVLAQRAAVPLRGTPPLTSAAPAALPLPATGVGGIEVTQETPGMGIGEGALRRIPSDSKAALECSGEGQQTDVGKWV